MMSHILLNNRKKTKAPLTKEMFHIRPIAKLSKRFKQVFDRSEDGRCKEVLEGRKMQSKRDSVSDDHQSQS
jgi:hypothetical protein